MCGIAGIISRKPFPTSLIVGMTGLARHRGPNDEGFLAIDPMRDCVERFSGPDGTSNIRSSDGYSTCMLGHRRLSILDLTSAAHQPMSNRDGSLWIVHNGEIYNFVELKEELSRAGHTFKTHSDTEVILAAYQEWGMGAFNRLNGMWSFVIYDRSASRLICSRDRFGVKPFYYAMIGELFVFCSEIKQMTTLPEWHASVNIPRALEFLMEGILDHTDETLFDGVRQLQGGSQMVIDLRTQARTVTRWYDVGSMKTGGISRFQDAADSFKSLFEDSVRMRLRSDAPVGYCLSGGLDSSSIVMQADKLKQPNHESSALRTISVSFEGEGYDETRFARIVSEAAHSDHQNISPDASRLFETLSSLIWYQDEPFGSSSIYAQGELFRTASLNGLRVMLDGQGADEILCGYHEFFGPYIAELAVGGRLKRAGREFSAFSRIHPYRWPVKARLLLDCLVPPLLRPGLRKIAGRDFRHLLGAGLRPIARFAGQRTALSVRELSLLQMSRTSLPMLLHWQDRSSMAHSVENRTPFLDYRLVEFLLGLPSEFKLRDGMTKVLLRKALDGILPAAILQRQDKLGFAPPEPAWMVQHSDSVRRLLAESVQHTAGILTAAVGDEFEHVVRGTRPYDPVLWRALVFGQWMRVFNVQHHASSVEG